MRKAISRNCTSLPPIPHECNHLSPLLEGLPKGTTVYADKGYDSKENRQHLKEHQLLDGIMRKALRNRPLTEAQTKRNRYLPNKAAEEGVEHGDTGDKKHTGEVILVEGRLEEFTARTMPEETRR